MECRAGQEDALRALFAAKGLDLVELGEVEDEPEIKIEMADGDVEFALDEAREAWLGGLAEVLR
jgi:hypothetical protein